MAPSSFAISDWCFVIFLFFSKEGIDSPGRFFFSFYPFFPHGFPSSCEKATLFFFLKLMLGVFEGSLFI